MIVTLRCIACMTPLGRVNERRIYQPLTPNQVLPLYPDNPPPFHATLGDWRNWFCPVCGLKPVREDTIMTDDGEIAVPEHRRGDPPPKPEPEPVVNDPDSPVAIEEATVESLTCPYCRRTFKGKLGLISHIRHNHKEHKK